MLLSCSSCDSRYLINSADLKPNGRTVRCVTCGHEWFQKINLEEEESLASPIPVVSKTENNASLQERSFSSNLPSTYIKKENPKVFNSILVVIFLIVSIFIFILIKREGMGLIVLLNFYIQEFYFNIKLIIHDLAKLLHQIVN